MAFCPRCGAATQSQFCGACGAPTALPPVPAYPQMPQQFAPPAQRRKRWPWIVGIVLAVWLGGAWFFYQDNERRFAEARNTGVEILSTDEKTGVVTARDKKTGKIIKMDFNDIEPDQVRLPSAAAPSWIPAYPNATGEGTTADSPASVAAFYETELRKAGAAVTKRNAGAGGVVLSVRDAANKRTAIITVQSADSGSTIAIAAGSK